MGLLLYRLLLLKQWVNLHYSFLFPFFQPMANLTCIIHYPSKNTTYSKLKEVTEGAWEKIQNAKAIREEKGGDNHHKQQCDLVPDHIDPALHGIHLTPCYKKFTLIISRE